MPRNFQFVDAAIFQREVIKKNDAMIIDKNLKCDLCHVFFV